MKLNREGRVQAVYEHIEANPRSTMEEIARALWLKPKTCIEYVHQLRTLGKVRRVKLDGGQGGFVWEVRPHYEPIQEYEPRKDESDEPKRIFSSSWEPVKLPPDPITDALCRR